MTRDELAALLNGREYRSEITHAEEAQAKAADLVVVLGYSDDGVLLKGAIDDHIGAWDGTTFRVSRDGHALIDWESLDKDDEAEVERYFDRKRQSAAIEAIWSPDDPSCSWIYETEIPHSTFDVMEDGELYCRGIVFALTDVGAAPAEPAEPFVGESAEADFERCTWTFQMEPGFAVRAGRYAITRLEDRP